MTDAADRTLACRCREVTEADVMAAIRDGARSLRGVKIRTRAGTGLCQGQTCGAIIERVLQRELGAQMCRDERTERAPARALTVETLADSPLET